MMKTKPGKTNASIRPHASRSSYLAQIIQGKKKTTSNATPCSVKMTYVADRLSLASNWHSGFIEISTEEVYV